MHLAYLLSSVDTIFQLLVWIILDKVHQGNTPGEIHLCVQVTYGLSAVAAATSRRTLGDIVDESTTLFT